MVNVSRKFGLECFVVVGRVALILLSIVPFLFPMDDLELLVLRCRLALVRGRVSRVIGLITVGWTGWCMAKVVGLRCDCLVDSDVSVSSDVVYDCC